MPKRRTFATVLFAAAALLVAACAENPPPAPPPPPPAPVAPPVVGPTTMSERSLLTMAADIAFRSGGYTLTPAGRKQLDGVVPSLQGLPPGAKIVVYGYTDNQPVGAALKKKGIADNLDLSSKRANEVVRYLASKGISPDVMSGKGRGDTHAIAPNDSKQGRAQNRRIDVVVEQPAG